MAIVAAYPRADSSAVIKKLQAIVSKAEDDGLEQSTICEQLESWRQQLSLRSAGWANADTALADLQRLLRGAQPRRPTLLPRLPDIAGWVFDHWIAVGSLLTLIVSGFYGLAYARFYEELDISPEQAGLTTAQIISHSIIGGLAITGLASGIFFLVFAPVVPSKDASDTRSNIGSWANVGVNASITLFGSLVLALLAFATKAPVTVAGPLIALLFFFFALSSLGIKREKVRLKLVPSLLEFSAARYLALLVVSLAFGVAMTGLVTYTKAHNLGARARDGEAVRDPEIFGVPFLGVHAEPTLIAWNIREPHALRIPHCALYLGATDGQDVLYDHRTESTIQVPSNDIVLGLRRERTTCEAPVNLDIPIVRSIPRNRFRCSHGRWENSSGATYSYRWTVEGSSAPAQLGGESAVLDPAGFGFDAVAFCHVTAATPLGQDVAVSHAVVLPFEPSVSAAPSASGFHRPPSGQRHLPQRHVAKPGSDP